MPSTIVLVSIGQYIIAVLGGLGFYYILAVEKDKADRKQLMDTALSYIINFILYMWLAKIIILFPLFIKDPFAVLPYPSDSRMFYLAHIFVGMHLLLAWKRKKIDGLKLYQSIVPILIMSNFIYEFMEVMFNQFSQSWSTLLLYSLLLLLYLFLGQGKNIWLILLWAVIQTIYGFYFSYTVLFGYMISPYYFIVIIIVVIIAIILRRSR